MRNSGEVARDGAGVPPGRARRSVCSLRRASPQRHLLHLRRCRAVPGRSRTPGRTPAHDTLRHAALRISKPATADNSRTPEAAKSLLSKPCLSRSCATADGNSRMTNMRTYHPYAGLRPRSALRSSARLAVPSRQTGSPAAARPNPASRAKAPATADQPAAVTCDDYRTVLALVINQVDSLTTDRELRDLLLEKYRSLESADDMSAVMGAQVPPRPRARSSNRWADPLVDDRSIRDRQRRAAADGSDGGSRAT
jgi:hypothetical protein